MTSQRRGKKSSRAGKYKDPFLRCHDSGTPTLKSPLSMMSMILYCWLMSFSSTRFFSAFSWSFLLVSNSRLSDAKRSGRHDVWVGMGTFDALKINQQREDTDFQVGVLPWSVRVRLGRAEGSGGQGQEHGAGAPHGQQRSAKMLSCKHQPR